MEEKERWIQLAERRKLPFFPDGDRETIMGKGEEKLFYFCALTTTVPTQLDGSGCVQCSMYDHCLPWRYIRLRTDIQVEKFEEEEEALSLSCKVRDRIDGPSRYPWMWYGWKH